MSAVLTAVDTRKPIDLSTIDPDLREYVYLDPGFGWQLKHPLCFDPVLELSLVRPAMELPDGTIFPSGVDFINGQLKWKRSGLREAEAKRDWHTFIYLHERPFRIDALLTVIDKIGINRAWHLVADVWGDTESASADWDAWDNLWSRAFWPDGRRKSTSLRLMSASERRTFAALPDIVRAWRGCNDEDAVTGFSWTLDRSMAEWFAHRFASADRPPILAELNIPKDFILAYFEGRNESEVVVHPSVFDAVQPAHEFLQLKSEAAGE
jgi:hypothetical protein